ncbi:UNVERIFIED_CONTAM: hypothetical protein RMT77_014604 [Armadillidium vulgare]
MTNFVKIYGMGFLLVLFLFVASSTAWAHPQVSDLKIRSSKLAECAKKCLSKNYPKRARDECKRNCADNCYPKQRCGFRDYRRLQTPETHSTYFSSRNRANTILHNSKSSFLRRECNYFSGSSSSRSFWHFEKNMSTLTSLLPLSIL